MSLTSLALEAAVVGGLQGMHWFMSIGKWTEALSVGVDQSVFYAVGNSVYRLAVAVFENSPYRYVAGLVAAGTAVGITMKYGFKKEKLLVRITYLGMLAMSAQYLLKEAPKFFPKPF